MQTVTLNVLDLLPCLICEPLVKSHSNKTQAWKRCRGNNVMSCTHLFTANELMLWRRNKGCVRQELPCCVFRPSEEEAVCVNNSTWREMGRAVLVCAHQTGLLWGCRNTWEEKMCAILQMDVFLGYSVSLERGLYILCICKAQSPAQLWSGPWLLSWPVCDHGGSVCTWACSLSHSVQCLCRWWIVWKRNSLWADEFFDLESKLQWRVLERPNKQQCIKEAKLD